MEEPKQPIADPAGLIAKFGLTVVDGDEAKELVKPEVEE